MQTWEPKLDPWHSCVEVRVQATSVIPVLERERQENPWAHLPEQENPWWRVTGPCLSCPPIPAQTELVSFCYCNRTLTKGLFRLQIILHYQGRSSQEFKAGVCSRNHRRALLACQLFPSQANAFFLNPGPPAQDGTTHSGWALPYQLVIRKMPCRHSTHQDYPGSSSL